MNFMLYDQQEQLENHSRPGGHSIVTNTGGGWLDSLGSAILVGKRYFRVLHR